MANEQRLIDAVAFGKVLSEYYNATHIGLDSDYYEGMQAAISNCIRFLEEQPSVDAVEVGEMKEFAGDVAYQFGYYCQNGGRLHITHGGLSTLEWAFDILGWENPHPVSECECEVEGCHEHATCGAPTKDGYKRMCGKHFKERKL